MAHFGLTMLHGRPFAKNVRNWLREAASPSSRIQQCDAYTWTSRNPQTMNASFRFRSTNIVHWLRCPTDWPCVHLWGLPPSRSTRRSLRYRHLTVKLFLYIYFLSVVMAPQEQLYKHRSRKTVAQQSPQDQSYRSGSKTDGDTATSTIPVI